MDRRSRFTLILAASSFLALGALSSVAFAEPKDAAAQKIDQNAMNNDFLMADFPKAEKNLNKAVTTCGASGCAAAVKARILVHLGIVLVNNGKKAEAEKAFIQAISLDKSVSPEKDFTTPDIAKIFKAAKDKAPAAGSATKTENNGGTDATAETVGEISHLSVPEQMVNTPVPIWVATPKDLPVGRILIRYKPFGGVWKKFNLKKKRGGWGGTIPCNDVTTTGKLRYYINVLDKSGDPLTALGSLNKPYVITIKNQLDGEPPHLPHEPPPARCQAKEDCPPGLPGCAATEAGKQGRGDKGWGATCEDTQECRPGFSCQDGVCEEGGDEGDGDDNTPTADYAKNWLGAFGGVDIAWLSGQDVCGQDSQQNNGYACFIEDGEDAGEQYHGQPVPQGQSNAIAGGFAIATQRLMVGYERAFLPNLTAGARVGWAFGGGPKPDFGNKFMPFHFELRASYWFGHDPLARKGFRPFVSVAGGIGQVDSMVKVKVVEQDGSCPAGDLGSDNYCHFHPSNAPEIDQYLPMEGQQLDVWRKAGQSFAGVGGGAVYAFNKNQGILAEARISYMFPTPNIVITPIIGYVHGF